MVFKFKNVLLALISFTVSGFCYAKDIVSPNDNLGEEKPSHNSDSDLTRLENKTKELEILDLRGAEEQRERAGQTFTSL